MSPEYAIAITLQNRIGLTEKRAWEIAVVAVHNLQLEGYDFVDAPPCGCGFWNKWDMHRAEVTCDV